IALTEGQPEPGYRVINAGGVRRMCRHIHRLVDDDDVVVLVEDALEWEARPEVHQCDHGSAHTQPWLRWQCVVEETSSCGYEISSRVRASLQSRSCLSLALGPSRAPIRPSQPLRPGFSKPRSSSTPRALRRTR